MSQPLGRTAGNAIEVAEAVETLHGNGPADLTELCIHLAGNMLWLADKGELPDCLAMAKATLADGSAFQKLRAMVQRQGGDVSYLDHPEKLPCAPAYAVQAEQDGFVAAMQTEEIGAVAGMLGAGRERKEDKVDPAAGHPLCQKDRGAGPAGRDNRPALHQPPRPGGAGERALSGCGAHLLHAAVGAQADFGAGLQGMIKKGEAEASPFCIHVSFVGSALGFADDADWGLLQRLAQRVVLEDFDQQVAVHRRSEVPRI